MSEQAKEVSLIDRTCGGCHWGRAKLGAAGVHLECRRLPPTVFMVPGPKGVALMCHYPPRKSSDPECGEFKPKISVA